MQRKDFKDHIVNNLGYVVSMAENNASYAGKDEKWLMAELEFVGKDLDFIVRDNRRMAVALWIVSTHDTPPYHRYANALRLYYHFINNLWYDNWRGSGRSAAKKTQAREKRIRKAKIEWNIPKRLTDVEVNNPYVFYAPSVPKEDRVPGLVSYLTDEYDHLISSKGYFILKDPMYSDFFQDNIFPKIPVVLSNEFPTKTYHETDEDIRDRIMGRLQRSNKNLEKDILTILKERDFTDRISGMYHHDGGPDYALCPWHEGRDFMFHHYKGEEDLHIPDDMRDRIRRYDFYSFPDGSNPYITIYYRNTVTPDPKEYKALLGNVLAHEYFHFLHDVLAGREFERLDFKADAVREGLADFFGMMYSLYCFAQYEPGNRALCGIAQQRYDGWVRRFCSSWPYANALYMYGRIAHSDDYYLLQSKCSDKFNDVLKQSKDNIGSAYSRLRN